jgi:hypothetical protein
MSYTTLKQDKYLVVREFLPAKTAKALAREFEFYCKSNEVPGDSQVPESQAFYNYPTFRELMYEKVFDINQILKIKLIPTYTYARVYLNGSTLERHTDREACEISLTVHLDGDTQWPFCLQKKGEEAVEINLNPGDAIIYMGMEVLHWRNKFEGEKYTQCFLHYVRSRGEYEWCEGDRMKLVYHA